MKTDPVELKTLLLFQSFNSHLQYNCLISTNREVQLFKLSESARLDAHNCTIRHALRQKSRGVHRQLCGECCGSFQQRQKLKTTTKDLCLGQISFSVNVKRLLSTFFVCLHHKVLLEVKLSKKDPVRKVQCKIVNCTNRL